MKTIILSESQYKRLFVKEDIQLAGGGLPDCQTGDEVYVTNNIIDSDGEPTNGDPLNTGSNAIANDLTPQNYWLNGSKQHNP